MSTLVDLIYHRLDHWSQLATQTWDAYRIPIILTTAALLLILRFYIQFSGEKEELKFFPGAYEPIESPESKSRRPEEKPLAPEELHPNAPVTLEKQATGPKRIKGALPKRSSDDSLGPARIQTLIFYSSVTAGTAKYAQEFARDLDKALGRVGVSGQCLETQVLDLAEIDYDEYFISPPKPGPDAEEDVAYFYLFMIPSYNIDSINDTFLEHLQETHHDFRIDTSPLSGLLGYSVFGFGDTENWPTEEDGYCFQAKEVDKWLAKLSGKKRAYPLGMGDHRIDANIRLFQWREGLVDVLQMIARTGSLGEGVPGSGDPIESDDEDEAEDDDGEAIIEVTPPTKSLEKLKKPGNVDDVEDLGRIMSDSAGDAPTPAPSKPAQIAVDFTDYGKKAPRKSAPKPSAPKEMVARDSPTYKALTKQGYAIVGSHSGVKICRWTKSALRGRGSCYKFSFYGIASHRCMEATPSLSCSNKCVFCWRHGTNPVGTTWRWTIDPPDLIFDGIKANHYQKIRTLRGVPGVRAERFAEANRIRHCALSLVGEPVFYPHINALLGMLHGEHISSFLVCNAQHPAQLAALKHVTQLYVSIDAPDKDSLRRIDRPLHRDFWERLQECLSILRERRHRTRTVFRLTLVKGFNAGDEDGLAAIKGYADMVEKALPAFVEIKGVTFCGTTTSAGAGLTMANVPWWDEVVGFVEALNDELNRRGLEYGLAAEHKHSCCALIASERFRVDGRWHTLIDYERFFELLEERGPDGEFSPEEYMGEATPEWANWGMGGFDPRDTRVDKKGRAVEVS